MPKNTSKLRRKKKIQKLKKRSKSILSIKSVSIEDLLVRAQESIDSFQFKDAQVVCQEILQRNADHVVALEISGNLCVEMKNFDGAKKCYGRAIFLQPDEGFRKYLAMGQLMEGKESFQCYMKGIELIKKNMNTGEKENENIQTNIQHNNEMEEKSFENSNSPSTSKSDNLIKSSQSRSTVHRDLSSTYCSISELYLTDFCDDEDAEESCLKYNKLAIESDDTNPEAYQQMANFLLVKQDIEGAKKYIKQSVELWLPNYINIEEGKAEGGSFDPIEPCSLSYETRSTTARLLIELEEYATAADVLECLLAEDDEIVDTWYLLGLSCYLRGSDYFDEARENFNRAYQVHEKNPGEEETIAHINEIMSEIGPGEPVDQEDDIDEEQLLLDSDDESMDCGS